MVPSSNLGRSSIIQEDPLRVYQFFERYIMEVTINSSLKEIIDLMIESKKNTDTILAGAIDALKNTDIPLTERWAAYTELVEKNIYNKNQLYGDGFIDDLGEGLTLYDEFYVERRETVKYVDMYERIMEDEDNYEQENISAWQEKVLQSGYTSFTYDW